MPSSHVVLPLEDLAPSAVQLLVEAALATAARDGHRPVWALPAAQAPSDDDLRARRMAVLMLVALPGTLSFDLETELSYYGRDLASDAHELEITWQRVHERREATRVAHPDAIVCWDTVSTSDDSGCLAFGLVPPGETEPLSGEPYVMAFLTHNCLVEDDGLAVEASDDPLTLDPETGAYTNSDGPLTVWLIQQ